MQGSLVFNVSTEATSVELPQQACVLVQRAGDLALMEVPADGDIPLLEIIWDKRACTWLVKPSGDHCVCTRNGKKLPDVKSRLSQNDTIQLGEHGNITFHRLLEAPQWNDQPTEAIDLQGIQSLIIGRTSVSVEVNEPKLCLDKDDYIISKSHARLELSDGAWSIEDTSKTGTDLNGKLVIGKEQLVYGDRFRISDYLFEYTGTQIKRIDHVINGSLDAKDLAVVVKDRVTGKPKRILNGVSTHIEPGEFIGILGGSGQGKSTFLDAMCGIKPATEGTVHIGGVSNLVLAQKYPGTIGYVPQDDIVHKELTVSDAFLYSGKLRLNLGKRELKSLIDRTIETLGLTEHREKRIRNLSGGQRKRVSIGIELLSKPAILFLDEPSSGLDPATEQSLMELLQALSLNKLTVICTTHVLQNAFIFNRLFFVHAGKLIFSGNTEEARHFFLDQGTSQTMTRSFQSPLERIYSAVLNGHRSAEEWENKFVEEFGSPVVDVSSSTPAKAQPKRKQPSPFRKLTTLLQRQWSIMRSDWLNIAFLFAQVIIIGLLTAWVSDDLGLRTFLGLIAAMWFGCSNGAQQIVGELPILQRERVCGLGTNIYILSKLIFQGGVSAVQCLVLFAVILFTGNYFHPPEFDAESFAENLVEREYPYIIDNSQEADVDDFLPLDESTAGGDELPMDDIPEEDEEEDEEPAKKKVEHVGLITWFAKNFHMEENILESGKQALSLDDGTPIMGEDEIQRTTCGMSITEVISTSIGLRIGAFLLATLVGVCLGLMVSALVRTTTQAVMWVPLLLIPQILFGGFVITLPEMGKTVRSVASIFPSNASQRLVDVSHIYGRMTPSLSNRTKTPLFLTSDGEKETVEWTDGDKKLTQDYQKISNVNTSWQNLAIRNGQLGEHKQDFNLAYGTNIKILTDTVDQRRDVRYTKGTSYQFINPATNAMIVLGIWMAVCYLTILIGLWKKKS